MNSPTPPAATAVTNYSHTAGNVTSSNIDHDFYTNKSTEGQGYNLNASAAAQQTTENIRRALRINESTNETGYATVQNLGRQRETIQHSLLTVDDTHQTLQESRGIIRSIRFEVYKEWLVKGSIIAAMVGLIILIFYVKFIKR